MSALSDKLKIGDRVKIDWENLYKEGVVWKHPNYGAIMMVSDIPESQMYDSLPIIDLYTDRAMIQLPDTSRSFEYDLLKRAEYQNQAEIDKAIEQLIAE